MSILNTLSSVWPRGRNRLHPASVWVVSSWFLLLSHCRAETPVCNPEMSQRWWQPASTEEAWRHLPPATEGQGTNLPFWARLLAPQLPGTTAALLRLDYVQRAQSPIPSELRAAMRYTCAVANGCDYAQRAATWDGRNAGISDEKWRSLDSPDLSLWSPLERRALRFAHDMTVSSSTIPDADFQALVEGFGPRAAASMVLLSAYSNMQDRLLLVLAADADADLENGVLQPVPVDFDFQNRPPYGETKSVSAYKTQPESEVAQPAATVVASVDADAAWNALTFEELQTRMEQQRQRSTRLPIPSWDEFAEHLPQDLFPEPSDIVWYRIALGYAHELALPFERVMRLVGAETRPYYDRVFGTSLFWIVTKAMECPYCMGHCEMNWEVAGLSLDQIQQRSQQLSGDDWSQFTAVEQNAFAFARKLSRTPAAVSDADVGLLRADFGDQLALAIAVQVSRYHYMVRISNGFQLTLEKENVFFDYWKKMRATEHSMRAPQAVTETGAAAHPSAAKTLGSDAEIWQTLPALRDGQRPPIPNFVKAVARQLPRTAAAMWELDAAHRLHGPLASKLRAKLRWAIGDANRCVYSQQTALDDLRRSGATESEIERLIRSSAQTPRPPEQTTADTEERLSPEAQALRFVRNLTLDAAQVTDEAFHDLEQHYGAQQTAAMVMLAAYGNFQDRILLGLQVPLEASGPLAAANVQFEPDALQRTPILPDAQGSAVYVDRPHSVVPADDDWTRVTYDQLQQRLAAQRQRTPRLPIPSWDEVQANLPSELTQSPTAIRWSLINYGYVPNLAIAWTTATRTHWSECPAERVLEESLFWVQTRAINCNYCMGHCEMLLQVAGLSDDQIAHRTKLLAETDWSAFPPAEQRAYAYARQLTLRPWTLTEQDYQCLVDDYGPRQAMGIFWWLCRGLYMTRISDGFQLPLEQENVFARHGAANADERD